MILVLGLRVKAVLWEVTCGTGAQGMELAMFHLGA